jgi:hypothetical protein
LGCTGGGRSVVGPEGEGVRGRDPERARSGEGERRIGPRVRSVAPATCSNERADVTDSGGLTRGRGGNRGLEGPEPSTEERELELPMPERLGGLILLEELFKTCKTRSCSRCASMRFAS